MPPTKRKRAIGDLVVLVPGIMGSVLTRGADELWSPSKTGSLLRLLRGKESLALPAGDPDADDGVEATDLIQGPAMIPDFWDLDSYSDLLEWLQETIAFQPGQLRTFPYDWRRDNRKTAQRFASEALRWLSEFRKNTNENAKLIIIAHSMGGLVSRYFTEKLGGWKETRLLATFGTPFGGSPKALRILVEGLAKFGVRFEALTSALRGFPSVYQLLPTYACYDTGDNVLRTLSEQSPVGVDKTMLSDAVAFHTEIRDAMLANEQEQEYLLASHRKQHLFRPIVGVRQPTPQTARLEKGHVILATESTEWEPDGDGTVPWISALPFNQLGEIADGSPIPQKHLGIHSSGLAFSALDFWLRGYETPKRFMNLNLNGLGLVIEDYFLQDQPIEVSVIPERPAGDLQVRVERIDATVDPTEHTVRADADGRYCVELPPLPSGSYRMDVSSAEDKNVVPNHHRFVVDVAEDE